MWVGRAAATMVTVGILVGACSSPAPPKVTVRAGFQVSDVGALLRKQCPTDAGRVTLDVTPVGIRHTFTCRQMREPEASVEATVAASVGTRHDAAHRVDRVIAFDKALGVTSVPRTDFVWDLATAAPYSCDHVADLGFRRMELSAAGESGESPVHWLKVEGATIAGECPDRLATLYRTISAIGDGKAVADVRPVIAAIKVA